MSAQTPGSRGFAALVAAVAVLAALAGFFLYQSPWLSQEPARPMPGGAAAREMLGEPRPSFQLPNLQGESRRIAAWDGRVVLVNFWATWCPPCREEMPMFADLYSEYREQGLTIVGVALDQRDKVRTFVDRMELGYPILVGSPASNVSRRYGNAVGALPYSALIDRQGRIRFVKAGKLDRQTLEPEIEALL